MPQSSCEDTDRPEFYDMCVVMSKEQTWTPGDVSWGIMNYCHAQNSNIYNILASDTET